MDDELNSNKIRSALAIARRAMPLHCVIAAAHGVSTDDIEEWLKEEDLWNELTPRELTFVAHDKHPEKEIVWMTWLVESQVTLLWSIQKLDKLTPPTTECDGKTVVSVMPGLFESTSPFLESAVQWNEEEIVREE